VEFNIFDVGLLLVIMKCLEWEEKMITSLRPLMSKSRQTLRKHTKYRKTAADIHDLDWSDIEEFVKYVSSQRKRGEITESDFTDLLTYACFLMVEREVEERVERTLIDKFLLSYAGK
jgi:hypothetical protein